MAKPTPEKQVEKANAKVVAYQRYEKATRELAAAEKWLVAAQTEYRDAVQALNQEVLAESEE